MRLSHLLAAGVVAFFLLLITPVSASEAQSMQVFWSSGCPHCAAEKSFLPKLEEIFPDLEITMIEVSSDKENANLFRETCERLGITLAGVPLSVAGDKYVMGFRDETTTGQEIISMIRQALQGQTSQPPATQTQPSIADDKNVLEPPPQGLSNAETTISGNTTQEDTSSAADDKETNRRSGAPEKVTLPLIGEVNISNASLPAFTIIMALLDGFNPCAMWVLLFLLSLLIGMPDRKRAWILGVSFILASSLVYFLFLTAWLNAFLILGYVFWIRIAVGIVALAAAVYYLHDFFLNRNGGCNVVNDTLRDKIFSRARSAVNCTSLALGILGITTLAFAVNMVELVCSAGLPAVYTQVLAMSNLPTWQYYAYLTLYILVFLIDDLFIFFTAMILMRLTGIQHKYTRYARLIGGVLMLIVGTLLLFKPEWLTLG